MTPANRQKEYMTQRILAASPMELIRLLYETAIQTVDAAILANRTGDIYGRGNAVSKAVGILSELLVSLRHDVRREYSSTLAGLYAYMQRQLVRAHSEQSEDLLREVSRLLNTLLEGWAGAMEKNAVTEKEPAEKEQTRKDQSGNEQTASATPPPVESKPSNPYSEETAVPALQSRSWQV